MKWVIVVGGVIAALGLLLTVAGALRPTDHVATITVHLAKSDSAVWAVASDFPRVPEWFDEVKKVERIADVGGRPAWREQYGGFTVTNVVREWEPNRKIVREILPEGAFSGTWTLELAPDGAGTKLTITERGHVGNPFFRGMMMFADPRSTMRKYAAALGKRLGVSAAH
jgi:hypothetical protein